VKIRGYLSPAIASDFIRKIAETFAARIVIIAIGLITTVIVARILGPEGRGLYAVALAVGTIGVQFSNLGLHASNTYYVAQDHNLLPTLLGNTIVVSFVVGGFGAALAWCVFTFWPNLAPINGVLLMMALIWIPIGLAYLLMQNLLIGIHEIRTYNFIEVVTKILGVSLIAIVILVDAVSVENIFLMGLVALIISFIWGLAKLKCHLKHFPKPSISLFKKNLRYGFKAYLVAFLGFMVLRVDLLMVQYLLGAEQAGYYSIAATMADMVYMLPVVVGMILFPKISAINNIDEKWKKTRTATIITGMIMLCITVLATVLASPVVNLLFSKEYSPAITAFIFLLPGIFFLAIETIVVQFLNSIGLPKILVYFWLFTTLFNIFFNYFFIPIYGIKGASIVSSASYFIIFVLISVYTTKIIKN